MSTALRYFKPSEFACKHCGENKMDPAFLVLADELRHRCGFPLPITSGYRCPTHNQNVSSTGPNGPHTTGKAMDVGVSRHRAHDVLRIALQMGFTGIGVQQKGASRFIHLDYLKEPEHAPRPSVWSY
jgi:zinc D-Ala-D-Ala carboxypeptidase